MRTQNCLVQCVQTYFTGGMSVKLEKNLESLGLILLNMMSRYPSTNSSLLQKNMAIIILHIQLSNYSFHSFCTFL